MSTYMSESLVGKVNLDLLENNFICLSINNESFKIKEAEFFKEKVIISFVSNTDIAYDLISKNINVKDIVLNWENKKILSYQPVSLMHHLVNDVDTYIIKIQINFEV